MQTVQQLLQQKINAALDAVGIDLSGVSPDVLAVVPCANSQFGDYQFNGVLPLAKAHKTNPRALAQSLLEKLDVVDISAPPEIAGPGFINFRLTRDFLEKAAAQVLADERLGVPLTSTPRTVVVDYPSPNVAKPLHVGHVRTMFIGDAIARLLRFAGHKVIADDHIGDWGTPIGMVIWGWPRFGDENAFQQNALEEMGRVYKIVKAMTGEKEDGNLTPQAKEALTSVREETAKLHQGDKENLALWQMLRDASQVEINEVYEQLDIKVDVTLGESFYHDRLGAIVDDLKAKNLAVESEGALIVPFQEPPHLRDKPMLVQKSDGSFLYATTDLATIQYRMETWSPDEMVYVVGAPQSDHFRQLFAAARLWGFEDASFKHISFGTVLGEDGTPLKSRTGESPKLSDLLNEAQSRARATAKEKNPELSEAQLDEIGRVIGIGALKYADLSQNRVSDYIFSWDKMLAFQGNSAPYLIYAYVRVRSIFRRAQSDGLVSELPQELTLSEAAELDLVKFILRFPLAIETALNDYRINALSDYLFELSQKFTAFYDACPVVKSESPIRESRLALCELTARALKQGLNLLGIETVEQM